MGFALTLDADSIGAVLLDHGEAIEAGSRVTGTGEVVRVPVGPGLLGRIVDPLGRPLDRDEPVKAEAQMPVERPAPAIIERDLVAEPVQTGILTVDALFAVGRGQRETHAPAVKAQQLAEAGVGQTGHERDPVADAFDAPYCFGLRCQIGVGDGCAAAREPGVFVCLKQRLWHDEPARI